MIVDSSADPTLPSFLREFGGAAPDLNLLSLPGTRYLLWSLELPAETDTVRGSMTALLVALLAPFRSSVRSRLELEAEIFALRHQLAVLQRQAPSRPRLDRVVWVLLSRLWPNRRRAVQIVTPDTVVRWHRRGFALSATLNSRGWNRTFGQDGPGHSEPDPFLANDTPDERAVAGTSLRAAVSSGSP